MTDQAFEIVSGVIADVFNIPAAHVSRDTEAADVIGWDSLAHSRVIMSIERRCAVRLPALRAFGASSVGALSDLVAEVRSA